MSTQVINQTHYSFTLASDKSTSSTQEGSLRDKLFERIIGALQFVGKDSNDRCVFSVQWSWNGTKEIYYFGYRDVMHFVDDILDEHPRCWEYRKAVIALIESESGIVDPVSHTYRGQKAWFVNHSAYYDVRNKMLDLTTPTGKHIFDAITKLGPNPTQGLCDNLEESKRLANLLINKCWRTKKDFYQQVTANDVRIGMIKDILVDPINAMQSNSYVYSAMKEHSGSWK